MMRHIFVILLFISGICLAKPIEWQAKPGTVALTFDDGPSPIYTPQVLKILKEYDVKATFFVMGLQAKKYPQLIKQIKADGHAIAIHSMTHPKLTKLSQKKLHYEVVQARDNVTDIIKTAPVCLRPPYGITNQRIQDYVKQQGMVAVPMGFNSFDYENRGSDWLANWVIKNAVSQRVFLLHDGYNHRQQTVDALPNIIKGIRKKGLGFSAICYPQQQTEQSG